MELGQFHLFINWRLRVSLAVMTPEEVWRLIQTADNFLKYGDDERARQRARKRFLEALAAANEIGSEPLMQQIKVRLADLDRLDEQSEA